MQEYRRSTSVSALIPLLILLFGSIPASLQADENDTTAVSEHLLQAELALQQRQYLQASIEYRKAAEQSESVEIARKATRLGFAYKFNDEALLAAERWLQLDKESAEARGFLALLYFRVDRLRDSRRQFERLIKASTGEPGAHLLSFVGNLSDQNEPERADKLMRLLAKRYKNSADAHYAVAVLALQAGNLEHAKARVRRSLEIEPDSIKPQLLFARALLLEGAEDAAIEYLAHIIADSAQPDADARMELALIYMLTERDDDALSQVNQILLEQPRRADALRLMAIINFRLERLDAAWDDFQDLLASGKYRMDALYYLARIADYRDEYERAVRLYREVRSGSNTVSAQRRASALLAHQLDDVDRALSLLDDFAKSSPDNAVEMVVTKAQLLASLGRYDEGLAIYDKAIEYRPDNESMVLGRAELLLRAGHLDDSIAQYRRAAERWPESALTLNALGYTLTDRTDQHQEALLLIEKALQLEPESAAIIDSMGWVLHKLGRSGEARAYLEKAHERLPDHEVAAHLIEVLAELEQRDEALVLLQAAEQKNPDSELLRDVRARYFPEASE